jgi:hypothetical protein
MNPRLMDVNCKLNSMCGGEFEGAVRIGEGV